MRFGGTKGEIRVKKGDLGEISPKKYFFLFNFFFFGGGAPLSPLIIMKYQQWYIYDHDLINILINLWGQKRPTMIFKKTLFF